MRYFAKITQDYWALKNRAHEQAREAARQLDRTLIMDKKDGEIFLDTLRIAIDHVNTTNPRCKPLHLHIYSAGIAPLKENEDCYAIIDGNFHITIFTVKE